MTAASVIQYVNNSPLLLLLSLQTQTDRQTKRQTDTQRDRQTDRQRKRETCEEAGRFQLETLSELVVVVVLDPDPLPLLLAVIVVPAVVAASVTPSLGLVVAMSQYLLPMIGI